MRTPVRLRIPRTPTLLPRLRTPFFRTISSISTSTSPSNIAYTTNCPAQTCSCSVSTPPDLDIDRASPLLHTVPQYAQHVVLCTGKDDWSSRIEDEEGVSGEFLRGIRGEIGRGGKGFDPFNNILLTMGSFPTTTSTSPTPSATTDSQTATTALLFPSFLRIPLIPTTSPSPSTFATAYLKAEKLHTHHASLTPTQKAALTRDASQASLLPAAEPITRPTILICGHGSRDSRCGALGPVLRTAFQELCARKGVDVDVGIVSHVGGHKFAGNVVLYLPPSYQFAHRHQETDAGSGLAGAGVWYGRVGVEEVEGVVEETLLKGRVIASLLRGGVLGDGRGDLGRVVEGMMAREKGDGAGDALKLKPRVRR
ncbi:unnamed protein product [Periconia digitata]|uniref:Altered inheritance of mitochondria protein 32 n=1 Tax=Periconia digitata TaxID=1303443 RepID=A0A9W4XJA4_9PLEO|nr:unnamed protein product [Periconia digitata]